MSAHNQFDVAVIGAGPSGSVASALLNKQGFKVCVLEKQHFPRFVIGESLLPHCMEMLEEAGFADAVRAEKGFQFKNGAAAAAPRLTSPRNFQTARARCSKCAAKCLTKS